MNAEAADGNPLLGSLVIDILQSTEPSSSRPARLLLWKTAAIVLHCVFDGGWDSAHSLVPAAL